MKNKFLGKKNLNYFMNFLLNFLKRSIVPTQNENLNRTLPTVNFHLIKACNFRCKFCYATFDDIKSKGMSKSEQINIIRKLNEAKLFRKINFAGGEPTLLPYIDYLIQLAKKLGFETSIVTNASKVDAEWVRKMANYLDILTISIDSIEETSNIASGRSEKGKTLSQEHLLSLANAAHEYGIQLKVNTVVSKFNYKETLTDFINQLKPFRWKVLQVTRIEEQNDLQFEAVKIYSNEFEEFCNRNKEGLISTISFIKEPEDIIQGSYLMIDPLGRFYDSSNKKYNYSDKILEVGVEKALSQVYTSFDKFEQRNGNYSAKDLNI